MPPDNDTEDCEIAFIDDIDIAVELHHIVSQAKRRNLALYSLDAIYSIYVGVDKVVAQRYRCAIKSLKYSYYYTCTCTWYCMYMYIHMYM